MTDWIGEAKLAVQASGYSHPFGVGSAADLSYAIEHVTAALLDAIDGGDLEPRPERVAALAAQLRALRMLDVRARWIAERMQRTEATGAPLEEYLDGVLRERFA